MKRVMAVVPLVFILGSGSMSRSMAMSMMITPLPTNVEFLIYEPPAEANSFPTTFAFIIESTVSPSFFDRHLLAQPKLALVEPVVTMYERPNLPPGKTLCTTNCAKDSRPAKSYQIGESSVPTHNGPRDKSARSD